jgi:hypothetical protein
MPIPQQMVQARVKRWEREEIPYWKECKQCTLSCKVLSPMGAGALDQVSCHKKHDTDPKFPYKYQQMKKESK